jgi:integrase
MSIYKRGDVYWYKFMWRGELIRESTKQGNDKVARQQEAAHRTLLSNGEVFIREKKQVPTFGEFIKARFEPWARGAFDPASQTWKSWYSPSIHVLLDYRPLCERAMDEITSEHISGFSAHLQARGLKPASVNARLRVVNRIFHLAVEWGVIERVPKVKFQTGARHRERVITSAEEAKYLAAAGRLLARVTTVLVDTGMRPEECFRQRWENVTWVNGRHGSMLVTHGKTATARRVLPMTPRVRAILEAQWDSLGRPEEGWVWPAPTISGHMEPSTVKKQHRNALRLSGVRPFVLYTLRHTFLTRLGASGCDAWTLARIAGHSSISISQRYVHPGEDAVLNAMERLGGHNTGHSAENGLTGEMPLLAETAGVAKG